MHMKLIIFGATGSVGKHLVAQALQHGHQVTAFVRDAQKLSVVAEAKLKIITGDVLNLTSVEQAIIGQEAVLCCLGAGRKGRVRSEGTRNIVAAMQNAGVKRFICQSTLGAGDSWQNLNFLWKRIMFGWLLKEAFEDHQKQEAYVKSSALDWTIVRPGAFTNGAMTAMYNHGFSAAEKGLTLKISRADVAHFMLAQLASNQYLKKTPGLSY